MNPVFQSEHDGKWYFWDESETYDYGPYDTKESALAGLAKYTELLLGN